MADPGRRHELGLAGIAALSAALLALALWASAGSWDETRRPVRSAATPAPAPQQPPPVPAGPAAEGVDAPPAAPLRLRISALGLDAPLVRIGLGPDGEIGVPPQDRPQEAAWFNGSVLPGAEGTSVIVGHVDTGTGPAVFWGLSTLHPGVRIDVQGQDRRTSVFAVDQVSEFARSDFPAERVYGAQRGAGAQLRLITCGGRYDPRHGGYTANTVAFAHLVRR